MSFLQQKSIDFYGQSIKEILSFLTTNRELTQKMVWKKSGNPALFTFLILFSDNHQYERTVDVEKPKNSAQKKKKRNQKKKVTKREVAK